LTEEPVLIRFTDVELDDRSIGTSLLILPIGGRYGSPSEAIVELLREFAHDVPLHELGRHINAADWQRNRPSVLWSQPEALDSLRLSQAVSGVAGEILGLPSTATGPGLKTIYGAQLRRALDFDAPGSFSDTGSFPLDSIDGPTSIVRSDELGGAFFETALRGIRDFSHESDGLIPMAVLRKAIASQRGREPQVAKTIAEALQPDLQKDYLNQQARTVDITIRRVNSDGTAGVFIASQDSLSAGVVYRIRVQIGRRSSVSLVIGNIPPIDLLLPPLEKGRRHLLHVALYTNDFTLKSPILQPVELPEVGPSPEILFDVSPLPGVRVAHARVAVYYDLPPEAAATAMRNHLIQSFMLTSVVGDESGTDDSRGVSVKLEFSLNGRFRGLENLQPRLMSLALNEGQAIINQVVGYAGQRLKTTFYVPEGPDADRSAMLQDFRTERVVLRPGGQPALLGDLNDLNAEGANLFIQRTKGYQYVQLVAMPVAKLRQIYQLQNDGDIPTGSEEVLTGVRRRIGPRFIKPHGLVEIVRLEIPPQLLFWKKDHPKLKIHAIASANVLYETAWRATWLTREASLIDELAVVVDIDPFQLISYLGKQTTFQLTRSLVPRCNGSKVTSQMLTCRDVSTCS
jgi:hypothetical protein